jgi:choline dehydrogenase
MKAGRSYNQELQGIGLLRNIATYLIFRKGILADCVYDVGAFIKTRPDLDRPDGELLMAPFSYDFSAPKFALEQMPGLQCAGFPLRPQSVGEVSLRSSDPNELPVIRPNYLATEYDRRTAIQLFRYIRQLFNQESILPFLGEETNPAKSVNTDDEILDAYRRLGGPTFHACGSCSMGPEEDDVVDDQLKVRGVSNLRIVDASVLPTMPSGNTNGPVMAVAWRAADLIIRSLGGARPS